MLFSFVLCLGACGNANDFPDIAVNKTSEPDNNQGDDYTTVTINGNEKVLINESPLANETEVVPAPLTGNYKDFLENFIYDEEDTEDWDKYNEDFNASSQVWTLGVKTLYITFTEDDVSYSYVSKKGKEGNYDPLDFTIINNGAHITVTAHTKCNYVLQGSTSKGSFKLYSDKKCIITLNGLTLTNPDGAAINIQKGNDGSKRAFLVVKKGTQNFLADGTVYTEKYYPGTTELEDEKGAIFTEGALIVSGGGYLRVAANGKNALASDDYVYLHKGPQLTLIPAIDQDGIKAKDEINIAGGVLNVVCQGEKAKGLNTEGHLYVNGGRTAIHAVTPLKCISTNFTGGELTVNGSAFTPGEQ